jgi:UPF0489 domain
VKILDLDLDFFLLRIANWRSANEGRLDAAGFPVWSADDVVAFLTDQCNVTGRVRGFAVDHHAEVFLRWREGIERGEFRRPFSVTHVDAHADLGLGDIGYVYLLTELVWEPVEARTKPRVGDRGLTDGNWLAFAIACRWLSDLTYVFPGEDGRPGDLMPYVMEDFSTRANNIELPHLRPDQISDLLSGRNLQPSTVEPRVPLHVVPHRQFVTEELYDLICLTRSPEFTPPEADALFDLIRDRFIEE